MFFLERARRVPTYVLASSLCSIGGFLFGYGSLHTLAEYFFFI